MLGGAIKFVQKQMQASVLDSSWHL